MQCTWQLQCYKTYIYNATWQHGEKTGGNTQRGEETGDKGRVNYIMQHGSMERRLGATWQHGEETGGKGRVNFSLGPRPKTNPSADCFQYCACVIHAGWGLGTRLG